MKRLLVAALLITAFLAGVSRANAESPPLFPSVCFSPKGNCAKLLVDFMGTANKRLDIAIYSLVNRDIMAAIVTAKNRGVTVRVVCDKLQAKSSTSLIDALAKIVPVKYGVQKGIMHLKMSIVDGKFLEEGSMNYTNAADLSNNEDSVYLDTPSIVSQHQERFENIWIHGTLVHGQ